MALRVRQSSDVPWVAATKIGVPDEGTSSLLLDIGDLEQDGEHKAGTCWPLFLESNSSRTLDVC